ncbi:AMP-binding protein [Sphingoaurantiacus capsulatus]|uniref:AMP-binding protein n=1 Tax=Sphingoaurantiacus capsulatus TaxID=1771310 RepID=A0ABV7XCH6_9SPHN
MTTPLRTPPPSVEVDHRADGSILLRSPLPLPRVRQSLPHIFDETADAHPDRLFMRQRTAPGGPWRDISYRDARRAANGLAQWLIDQGLQPGACVAYLSAPSIEHGIVAVATQRAGIAIAPVSVAYSLLSTDHAKLRACIVKPGAKIVFVDDATMFGPAMRALADLDVKFVAVKGAAEGIEAVPFAEVIATEPGPEVARRMAAITPDMTARIMHTSGSTGSPKATPQPQSNMTLTVAQIEAIGLLDFGGEGPQHLEAMPFSHIMAGNFNFANVIRAGGTIHIDDGKPTPELFPRTIANLREVSPHFFITVPLGYVMLCDAMEADDALRDSFFRNMRYIGFGGAVLPEAVKDRLLALSRAALGHELPIFSFYGATEYLFGTLKYWTGGRTDVIGLPLPGTDLKMQPVDGRYELRVKGPTLMPRSGYLGAPEASADLFDDEGYYRTGDAVHFADPDKPEEGLVFGGRIADDFKLTSGTFVSVNALRNDLIDAAAPLLREVVLCGLNEAHVGALVWPSDPGLPDLRERVTGAIATFNAGQSGSSRRIKTAIIETQPLSFDAGELTDKGNISPRVIRSRRSDAVADLFADAPTRDVLAF